MALPETGDLALDQAAKEFRRTGNIDVFNNMFMATHLPETWRECGTPLEVTDQLYQISPFAAAVRQIGEDIKKDRVIEKPKTEP